MGTEEAGISSVTTVLMDLRISQVRELDQKTLVQIEMMNRTAKDEPMSINRSIIRYLT